ncbi:EpsG family protein [Oceanobacillus halophilus]|uniref:EpsG family protein n=1 Tax=Oceanobacillus halophilus TaxID=930130 RepID=UPI0011C48002|nr:EpsG family protein [Oceanobacillus halophilus]
MAITTLVFIFILMGGSGVNYLGQNDYVNYKIDYETASNQGLMDSKEIGYMLLLKFGNILNLDFFTFRLIILGICLIVIYFGVIKRYSYNSNYILLAYMLYPMIIDSEQFRNFIALTILLYGIRFLGSYKIKNKIKFLLTIIIASSIHVSFALYIVLLLVDLKNKKILVKGIALSALIFALIVFLNNNQIPFISSIQNLIGVDKFTSYTDKKTEYGFLIPFTLHTFNFLLALWAKNIIYNKVNSNITTYEQLNALQKERTGQSDISFINMIFYVNIIGFLFFPLFMTSLHFYRIVRNLMLLNFISYSIVSSYLKKDSALKLLFNLCILTSILMWLFLDLFITTSPERLIYQFFNRNYFLN